MTKISLKTENNFGYTTISNIFFDKFMPEANGEFVKVYLYLLRHVDDENFDCTICGIADTLNHTEKDIVRALKYWEKEGLIILHVGEGKKLLGITLTDITAFADNSLPTLSSVRSSDENVNKAISSAISAAITNFPTEKVTAKEAGSVLVDPDSELSLPKNEGRKHYTLDEIKAFKENESVDDLFFVMQTYLKRTFNQSESETVCFWYDALGFSVELIEYLVEYCISKGHTSFRYMDKVAIGWHESGVKSVEDAKKDAAAHSQAYYGVMKAMGISGRNLVDSEMSYINKWSKEYAFDLALILEACGRTIAATHQPSFEYTDSIITSWYNSKVHTMDDVKKLDDNFAKTKKAKTTKINAAAPKKNAFNNIDQRNYDFNELETMLLNTNVQ